jgi:hypothetical protein
MGDMVNRVECNALDKISEDEEEISSAAVAVEVSTGEPGVTGDFELERGSIGLA